MKREARRYSPIDFDLKRSWRCAKVLTAVLAFATASIAVAQEDTGENKFPVPEQPTEKPNDQAPAESLLAAGSLAIQAVQGTPGAPPIGSVPVEVTLIQENQIIDTINTQLDEFGVVVLRDLPIEGGIYPLVWVRYGEVKYQEPGVLMDPAHPQQRLVVTCYETTEEKPNWDLETRHLMITPTIHGISVAEFAVARNPLGRTWMGDGHGEPGTPSRKTIIFGISEWASDVDLGSGFLEHAATIDTGYIVSHLPLTPGKSEFKFSYFIHADPKGRIDFEIPMTSPVSQFMLIIAKDLNVESFSGIEFGGAQRTGGSAIAFYRGENLQPLQSVSLKLSGIDVSGGEGGEVASAGGMGNSDGGTGSAFKLIAGIGAGVLLLGGIIFIFMKSPASAAVGASDSASGGAGSSGSGTSGGSRRGSKKARKQR